MDYKYDRKAFTLIELLVVISIIAILATVVFVNYNGAKVRARDNQRITDLANVKNAITMYEADRNAFPVNPYAGSACGFPGNSPRALSHFAGVFYPCLEELVTSGYIDKLPEDPQPTLKMYAYFNYGSLGYYILFANTENPRINPDLRTVVCKDGKNCFNATTATGSQCNPEGDKNGITSYCLFDFSK